MCVHVVVVYTRSDVRAHARARACQQLGALGLSRRGPAVTGPRRRVGPFDRSNHAPDVRRGRGGRRQLNGCFVTERQTRPDCTVRVT